MGTVEENAGPEHLRHSPENMVFVNRNIYLHNIKCYGFDMDFTLAEYKYPEIDFLIFHYSKKNLVDMGYPNELEKIEYNPSFSARGVIFDAKYGNVLKIDTFGMILLGIHGFSFLDRDAITKYYPSRFIQISYTERYFIFNTMFELSQMYLISALISYFENHEHWTKFETGVECGKTKITYETMRKDVNEAVDMAHNTSQFKSDISRNPTKYINKRIELPKLLYRLKNCGKKTFIITNSDYWFTNTIMTYLFEWPKEDLEDGMTTNWRDYFDIIIVDAKKPLFFLSGTILKKVDLDTGKCSIGHYVGPLVKGSVYSGGDSSIVTAMLETKGSHVLYIGDHIFGDILKSKKHKGWRTFLVVPELKREIDVWKTKKYYFDRVAGLEAELVDSFKSCDSHHLSKVDITSITSNIKEAVIKLESCYGPLGSLMRCGIAVNGLDVCDWLYADLYSSSCVNLIHYPFDYFHRAGVSLMAHEVNVKQDAPTPAAVPALGKQDTIIAEEEFELAASANKLSLDSKKSL